MYGKEGSHCFHGMGGTNTRQVSNYMLLTLIWEFIALPVCQAKQPHRSQQSLGADLKGHPVRMYVYYFGTLSHLMTHKATLRIERPNVVLWKV